MNLADWATRLMAARRVAADPLFTAAQRAASRATYNSMGKFSFHVERTRSGAKIIGFSLTGTPTRLADDVVRRHLEPELARARQEIAQSVRESLTS